MDTLNDERTEQYFYNIFYLNNFINRKNLFGDYQSPELDPLLECLNYFLIEKVQKPLVGLRRFINSAGLHSGGYTFLFPEAIEYDDKDIFDNAILFQSTDTITIVDYPTFYKYLTILINEYLKLWPKEKEEIEHYMHQIRSYCNLTDKDLENVQDNIIKYRIDENWEPPY